MFHTYKQNKSSSIADEKRKDMNIIRFMNKLVELGISAPLKRDDKNVITFMDFQDFKYHKLHPQDRYDSKIFLEAVYCET